MTEIIERPMNAEEIAEREQWAAEAPARALAEAQEMRRAAYTLEADPLNFTWQETQLDADRVAWLTKKDEIKARFPYPEVTN